LKLQIGHAVRSAVQELGLKGQMQLPGLRQVGADRPTNQLQSSLGLYQLMERSDMVELEVAMDLKLFQEGLACYPMSTAQYSTNVDMIGTNRQKKKKTRQVISCLTFMGFPQTIFPLPI
jgi:hypothetical protein